MSRVYLGPEALTWWRKYGYTLVPAPSSPCVQVTEADPTPGYGSLGWVRCIGCNGNGTTTAEIAPATVEVWQAEGAVWTAAEVAHINAEAKNMGLDLRGGAGPPLPVPPKGEPSRPEPLGRATVTAVPVIERFGEPDEPPLPVDLLAYVEPFPWRVNYFTRAPGYAWLRSDATRLFPVHPEPGSVVWRLDKCAEWC